MMKYFAKEQLQTLALVWLIGTFLTIAITWPFSLNLGSYYTDYGDYPLNAANFWYNEQSIVSGKIFDWQNYFNGFQAYPQPNTVTHGNNAVVPSIVFTPIYLLTKSLIFSINSLAFLSFVLTFVSAFYVLNYFLKNRWSAIVGAAVIAFNPLILGRFPLHLDLMNRYFLPPVVLFSWLFFNKPSLKRAIWLAIFFTLNALSVAYYFFFGTAIITMLGAYSLIKAGISKDWLYLLNLLKYGLVGLLFVPVLVYFYLPFYNLSQQEGASRSIGENVFFSARIIDYIVSTKTNLVYGGLVQAIDGERAPKDDKGDLNYEEHTLGLNVLPIILFGIGAFYLFKVNFKTKTARAVDLGYFLILMGVSWVLTFGPYFTGWNSNDGTIPLPFLLLYNVFPFFKAIRVPTRFEFIFYLPFGLIVSFGVIYLLSKWPKHKYWIVAVALSLIIIENMTTQTFQDRSAIIPQIKSQSQQLEFLKNKVTLHLPVYFPDDAILFGEGSAYLNWATQTGEKIVNINSGYLPPDQLELLDKIRSGLDENTLNSLVALKVDYLVIHKQLFNKSFSSLQQQLLQTFQGKTAYDSSDLTIFRLSDLNLHPAICDIKNLHFQGGEGLDQSTNKSFNVVIIKNDANCYFPSLYSDRYRQLTVDWPVETKQVKLRFPIIIEPYAQITLLEPHSEVKILSNKVSQ